MDKLQHILNLPDSCMVNKKLTKAFFKRNFDLTLSERKLLDDPSVIYQMEWMASIKPQNSNILPYTDLERTFDEVQVITVSGGENWKKYSAKVADLVQKYIPYHIVLVLLDERQLMINTAEKRFHLNDASLRTIERTMSSELIDWDSTSSIHQSFLVSLDFQKLDKGSLQTLYRSYVACINSLKAAYVEGVYKSRSSERLDTDLQILNDINQLELTVAKLSALAKKETQLSAQINLNLEVQQLKNQLSTLKSKI